MTSRLYTAPSHWLSLAALAAVAYVVYKNVTQVRAVFDNASESAGNVLHDMHMLLTNRSGVILNDLLLQPNYLDENYRLKDDARRVIARTPEYSDLLTKLFNDDGILHDHYRNLIGTRINGDLLT